MLPYYRYLQLSDVKYWSERLVSPGIGHSPWLTLASMVSFPIMHVSCPPSAISLAHWTWVLLLCLDVSFYLQMLNETKCFKTLTAIQHVLGCRIQAFLVSGGISHWCDVSWYLYRTRHWDNSACWNSKIYSQYPRFPLFDHILLIPRDAVI